MVARLWKSCFTLLVLLLILMLLPLPLATAQPSPAASVSTQRAEESTPEGQRAAPLSGPDAAPTDSRATGPLSPDQPAGTTPFKALNPAPLPVPAPTGGGTIQAGAWLTETVDSAGDVGSYSSLALDPLGNPHIVYNDGTSQAVKYAYFDGAWHIEVVDATGAVSPSLALDSAGNPHISYYAGTDGDLKYAYHDGTTWHLSTVDSAGDVGSYSSLALDAAGNPHISYYDVTSQAVKYARFDGTNWLTETVDSAAARQHPSLALDAADRPHISYYGIHGELMYALFDGAWQIQVVVSSGTSGVDSSLALDALGRPHISYHELYWNRYWVRYAFFDGAYWYTSWVEWGSDPYSSLALDTAGRAHISYSFTGYGLNSAVLDGTWQIERVDAAGGGSTSLALDAAGRARISYYDAANGDLQYAREFFVEAVDDDYATPQDTPLILPTWQDYGVLDNDVPGGGLLQTVLDTPPAEGALVLSPDGSFTYTPTLGSAGLVTFTYAAQLPPRQDIATVRLLVGDVDRPVAVFLDNDTVSENEPAGTLVGTLHTLPTGPSYSYELAAGTGSEDNAAFAIAGSQLQTARVLDYEQKSVLRLRVRTTDERGLYWEEVLVVRVGNAEPEPPGPPPRCSGQDIVLVDSEQARVWISDVTTTTWALGCAVSGNMNVEIPGNSLSGIPFAGRVDWWNHLLQDFLPPLDMRVSGVDVHVGRPQLSTYVGQPRLDLRESTLCAPAEWGGACKGGDQEGLLIDAGGFRTKSGSLPLPEFGIPNAVPLVGLQTQGALPQQGVTIENLNLKFIRASVHPVRDLQGKLTGYEITGSAWLGFPGFGSNKEGCFVQVIITLYQSLSGEVVLRIEPLPEGAAPEATEFREGKVSLSCMKGIPIDTTGLQVSGISGMVALKPDAQYVRVEVEITNIENFGLPLQLIRITAGITVQWKPEWGIDVSGKVVCLEHFESAKGEVRVRKTSIHLDMTLHYSSWIEGNIVASAWWPDGNFHFAGSGQVDVGFRKGSIWQKCFWIICIKIPPFNLTIGAGADFGEFTNGNFGAKGYVKILGTQYGFYADGEDFHVGGVGQYQLVEPPEFLAAYQRWQADRQAAELAGVQLDPMAWDDTFAFPRDNLALVKTTIDPTAIISQVVIITPTDVAFVVSTSPSVPVTITLVTPDGITITPDNYFMPPVSPTHNVFYTWTVYPTYTQYWYQVMPAMLGEWMVGVEGSITESNPLLAVLGFANIPQITDVVVLDGSDPSQVGISWTVTSDVVSTMTVYATLGPITGTVVVTDSGGITHTEVIYVYNGIPVGQFPLRSIQELRGTGGGVVDLTGLESGDYALWVGLNDAIFEGVYAYALVSGTNEVAWVTVDNSATWPGEWSPAITATIVSSTEQLVLTWDALDHPDVDDYTVYIGHSPGAPDQAIMGLSAFYSRDEEGHTVGDAFGRYVINNVAPGETYYVSVEARDVEATQTVRTAEVSATIPGGDYDLYVAQRVYRFAEGESAYFSIPLSLQVHAPLFYPAVYLEIDETQSARGIVAQFAGDTIGDTALGAGNDTVDVLVWLDQYLPRGTYTLTFIGHNGRMERRVAVDIVIGDFTIYLPLVENGLGAPRQR